jgi:DNA polymerase-1
MSLPYITFGCTEFPKKVVLLIPEEHLQRMPIEQHYITPLKDKGISPMDVIVLGLPTENGKTPINKVVKPFLDKLERRLVDIGAQHLILANAQYFKTLCKVTKADIYVGESLTTAYFESDVAVSYAPNYKSALYNPQAAEKIDRAMTHVAGSFAGGPNRTAREDFSSKMTYHTCLTANELTEALEALEEAPAVAIDIETTGLSLNDDIVSIAVSASDDSGVGFFYTDDMMDIFCQWLAYYPGKKIYHNGTFDTRMIILKGFMDHPHDYAGMVTGLHVMWKNAEDTKAMAYLCLNSTAPIELSLKALGHEYAGNWADNVQFTEEFFLKHKHELIRYNMDDTAVTYWVYKKYAPMLVAENQDAVYRNVFLPSLKTITQMELVGIPFSWATLQSTSNKLTGISQACQKAVRDSKIISGFNHTLREEAAAKANLKLKKLRKTADDFATLEFNPNSGIQVGELLHGCLGLPVLDTTETGRPSTSGDALKKHLATLTNKDEIALLSAIIQLHEVDKINNTFIAAFKDKSIMREGWYYLHGNFNLGGTVSGRLSSSKPNLQNLPSTGTDYAKDIKRMVKAPAVSAANRYGWLFIGADYASLEDRISALITKDPNKLGVYTKGYDGHSLRAYAYFSDQMPDITEKLEPWEQDSPEYIAVINSIRKHYPKLRQHSKGPTFALTYMGTANTLHKNFGIPMDEARKIETEYHKLYAHSDAWVNEQVKSGFDRGYVELAFGMKLRTPLLHKSLINGDLPYLAKKEIKTAANALGQSYGLLNSHTANLFMQRVWDSEWAHAILPVAQIHDAQYYMVHNSIRCLEWINNNLIECMEWQALPAIEHDEVKLGAELDVFYPSWADPTTIPNGASRTEIYDLLN